MYELEADALNQAFINLENAFVIETICSFLKVLRFLPYNHNFTYSKLERIIYGDGDVQEIYNRQERKIIKKNNGDIYYTEICADANNPSIKSRLFAVELEPTDTIYDSISVMKLINKAIDGFNIFLFVSPQGIYIGCTTISKEIDYHDCILSPIINSQINWEKLYTSLTFIADLTTMMDYYNGILYISNQIRCCYLRSEFPELYAYSLYHEDDSNDDDSYDSEDSLYDEEPLEQSESLLDIVEFDIEVESCMRGLSFIKKSHVNPLELLFEAESSLIAAEQDLKRDNDTLPSSTQEDDLPDIELLDDPLALLKKLKKEHGL